MLGESLEARDLLTTLYWQGDVDQNMSTVGNWADDLAGTDSGAVPSAGDTLIFNTNTVGFTNSLVIADLAAGVDNLSIVSVNDTAGVLSLAGTGPLAINSVSHSGTGGGLSINTPLHLTADTVISSNVVPDAGFANAIGIADPINAGSFDLTIDGAGGVVLQQPFGGEITNGSSVVVNGHFVGTAGASQITAPTTVNAGGIVNGFLQASGPLTVLSGGSVSPGFSPGAITTGDLNLADGSAFDIDINSPGMTAGTDFDVVNVTGSVSLGNVNYNVLAASTYTPAIGDAFTIIANDGVDPVVQGTNAPAEGAVVASLNGVSLCITYLGGDGNDVALVAADKAPPIITGGPFASYSFAENTTALASSTSAALMASNVNLSAEFGNSSQDANSTLNSFGSVSAGLFTDGATGSLSAPVIDSADGTVTISGTADMTATEGGLRGELSMDLDLTVECDFDFVITATSSQTDGPTPDGLFDAFFRTRYSGNGGIASFGFLPTPGSVAPISDTILGNSTETFGFSAVIDDAGDGFDVDFTWEVVLTATDPANCGAVSTIESTDADGDTEGAGLTYSISGGADAAKFSVNTNTGELTFNSAPNFESPGDVGGNNIYDVEVTVTDSTSLTDSQSIRVTVTDVVESATLTLSKTDDSVAENTAFTGSAPTLTGAPIGTATYSLSGTDAGLFSVNASSGVVTMIARDFESPADANTDNVYEATLEVTDSDGNTASDDFKVTVTDAVETVSLNLTKGNDTVAENSAYTGAAPTLTGTPIGTATYSLSGTDAGLFSVNASSGVVTMVARNFESPADANTDNVYEATLEITDTNGNSASDNFTVTVTDAAETVSLSLSKGNDTVAENSAYTGAAPTLTGTPIGTATYSLSGSDAGLFSVNASSGVVTMVARNFESPADANTDNVYEATLKVTDSDGNTASDNFKVTVTDAVETVSLNLTKGNDSVAENSAYTGAAPTLTGTPIGSVTYSLSGTDAGKFTLTNTTGVVKMVARNFESPADANTNNVYEATLKVTDSDGNTASDDFTVTVTNVNEGPSTQNQTFSVNENTVNGTVVGTLSASDIDSNPLTFSSTSPSPAFTLTSSGEIKVSDQEVLDFETTPSFTVGFEVTDGLLSAAGTATININNLNEFVPEIEILSIDGTEKGGLDGIRFTARSSDVDDGGDISERISWTSSLDGLLGSGPSIKSPLSVGEHVITALVEDSVGRSSFDTVDLFVPKSQIGVGVAGSTWGAPAVQLQDGTIVVSDSANRIVVSYAAPQTVTPTMQLTSTSGATVPTFSLTFWDGRLGHFESPTPLAGGDYQVEFTVPQGNRSAAFAIQPGTSNASLNQSAVDNIFSGARILDGTNDETDVDLPCNDLAGDANCDGVVGFADFGVLASNFGRKDATKAEGDLDGNGIVNFADFGVLAANFGRRLP